MKRNLLLFGLLLWSFISVAQIQITSNGENLYIEIEGITNLQRLNDANGNPSNWYTYRRENINLDVIIRPHITIVGGTCRPTAYMLGFFGIKTHLVFGFYENPNSQNIPYWPFVSPIVDELDLDHASGTYLWSGQIDFSRHYKCQHSLTFQISCQMWDVANETCLTPESAIFDFFLFPEPTPQELAFTAEANASGSDQDFWKGGNCNACNKKGVPGFHISTVTLLPGFSDQDYAYSSLGPDIDFSRYFSNPGTMGMYGNGWNFVYEQELITLKKTVQYQNGTGANELFEILNDSIAPFTYAPTFSNRKKMLYYPDESRFEIFDPDTKLYYDLQQYTSDNDTLFFHLSGIRDMYDNMVTLTYNSLQKITSITDAAGRTTSFQYDASDRCSQLILPDARSCSYEYNASGQMIRVFDIYANDVGFSYDNDGYVTSMRVNQDSATFIYYTDNGHRFLTSVTNLDGNTTSCYPDVLGPNLRLNRITDPSGKATIYEINPLTGSTIAKRDFETGARQEMKYDENKLLTDFILPSGYTSKIVYDSLKRVTQTIDFRGMAKTFEYDSLDNMTALTDAEGNTWQWFYDSLCSLTEKRTPLGKMETYTYYPDGLLKTHSYDTLQTYTFSYDPYGNISSIIYPNGGTGQYDYDPMGLRVTGYTDPEGNQSQYNYDDLDRITTSTNPDGSIFETIYDCCAPTGTIDENGNATWFERTPLLQITKETDAEGHSYNYTLDGANRVVEKIRPDGTKYQYTYNSIGKMAEETDPFNESVYMYYDLNGLLSSFTDQSGNVSTFQRSENGKIIALTIGSNPATYNRDSLDRIISYINARGQAMNIVYNADGLVQSVTSASINDEYAYDDLDRLSLASNAASAVAVKYNEMDAINKLTYDSSHQFNFYYDLNNDLVKTRYSDNSELIIKRDNMGRVNSLFIGTDSAGFQYDAASNLISIHRSNEVNTLIRRNKTNRIMALRLYNPTDTLMKWNYVRNGLGLITLEERTGILCGDSVFMRADTGGFYQEGNQLSQWQNLIYSYDDDGNLTQVNPGVFTASYDNLNRLTGWGQSGGSVNAQYYYNAKGYVSKKQLQNGASTYIFHFYYDAENRVIEITQDGTSAGWKFYYNDKSLVVCKVDDDLYFYHFDHQGNTVALSDRDGNIVKTYAYDAWGKILNETGSLDQPFKYSGAWGVVHEYNHLYRMPFRFYDSFTGKFIQRDPSGFQDGVNLYRYAQNNPVNFIDPTGLEDEGNDPSEEDAKAAYFDNNEYGRDENPYDPIYNALDKICGTPVPPGPPLPPSPPPSDEEQKKRDAAAAQELAKKMDNYYKLIKMLEDRIKNDQGVKGSAVGNAKA